MTNRARERWMGVLVTSWALVGVGILLVAVGWVMGRVSSALVPFLLALVLVVLLRSPVAWLEHKGVKRGLAVGICYLVGFVVLGGALAFLIPPFVDQVRQFIEEFPKYYAAASGAVLDLRETYRAMIVPAWVEDALANVEETVTTQSAEWSAALAKQVFSVGGSAVAVFSNLFLSLVAGFWILKDLPSINREAILLAGPRRQEEASIVTHTISRILSGYLRGQMILSAATAIIVTLGLTIFGVPYSLVIGILAGVFNVVPWVGPAVAGVVAGIAAAFVSPWHILAGVGTVIAAQQLTEIFVQPRVMSEQVDLHPLLVIFSLLVGATLFGFTGMVLAIPVAAVAKGLFVYYFEKYTDSKLTTEGGALFRSRGTDGEPVECATGSVSDTTPDTPSDNRDVNESTEEHG